MSAVRKAAVRELAAGAYELGAGVLSGELHRRSADGEWVIGDVELNAWLERFAGQEVYLITASLQDDRPLPTKTCRTCGTEYTGVECPCCRDARIRLRGR